MNNKEIQEVLKKLEKTRSSIWNNMVEGSFYETEEYEKWERKIGKIDRLKNEIRQCNISDRSVLNELLQKAESTIADCDCARN